MQAHDFCDIICVLCTVNQIITAANSLYESHCLTQLILCKIGINCIARNILWPVFPMLFMSNCLNTTCLWSSMIPAATQNPESIVTTCPFPWISFVIQSINAKVFALPAFSNFHENVHFPFSFFGWSLASTTSACHKIGCPWSPLQIVWYCSQKDVAS